MIVAYDLQSNGVCGFGSASSNMTAQELKRARRCNLSVPHLASKFVWVHQNGEAAVGTRDISWHTVPRWPPKGICLRPRQLQQPAVRRLYSLLADCLGLLDANHGCRMTDTATDALAGSASRLSPVHIGNCGCPSLRDLVGHTRLSVAKPNSAQSAFTTVSGAAVWQTSCRSQDSA